MPTRANIRLGVLLSGSGRTLQNFHDRITTGLLPARIQVVVASRADAYGIERARRLGLTARVVERRSLSPEQFDAAVTAALDEAGVELICMAGFLSLWRVPPHYQGRVMNIHPALLPEFGGRGFYGRRVHEAVLAARCAESGCTVHFCDNLYDHGPIILQRRVPVLPGDTPDTLAARVFEEECAAYPEAINLFTEGRLRIEGQSVSVLPPAHAT